MKADMLGELVITVFRANGAWIRWGDELAAPYGLTSARWQVLGALAAAGPLTVPAIARAMGLTRQAVQKQVDALCALALLALRDNPEHQRSPLVALTAAGRKRFDGVDEAFRRAAEELARTQRAEALAAARALLDGLTERLATSRTEVSDGRTSRKSG